MNTIPMDMYCLLVNSNLYVYDNYCKGNSANTFINILTNAANLLSAFLSLYCISVMYLVMLGRVIYFCSMYLDLCSLKYGHSITKWYSSPIISVQNGHVLSEICVLLYRPISIGNLWFPVLNFVNAIVFFLSRHVR